MMRALVFVLFVVLAPGLSAQLKGHIQIKEDVMQGTSMQIYLDFNPAVSGSLPSGPIEPEDALLIIEPTLGDLTSAGFGGLLASRMNDAFRLKGLSYQARFREKDGDRFTHDTVTVLAPVSLQGIFISPDSATSPNTEVTGAAGISFNPTFANFTRRIENAYPGSPNAQLLINDIDPAIDPLHQVEVFTPGLLKFSFLSGMNVNQPIVFILSDFYNPETIPQAFIGFPGSLDIGTHNGVTYQNVVAIADAITGSSGNPFLDQFFFTDQNGRLDFSISLGLQSAGESIAAQAIIADPTQPLGLAFTQAADINAAVGKELNLALGDDGGMQVAFEPGTTFDYYGVTYSAINVNANGFVTFGGAAPSGAGTALIDPIGAVGGPPSIFANWGDWDTTGVGVTYREFGRELRVSWGSSTQPISRAGAGALGSFTLTLHLDVPLGTAPPSQRFAGDGAGSLAASAGSVFLDMDEFLSPTAGVAVFDAVMGVSPGGITVPVGLVNESFSLPRFPHVANRPSLIQHDRTDSAQSSLPVASGGNALYRSGAAQDSRIFAFFPTPVGMGTSYVSIVDRDQEDDLQGADIAQISVSAAAGGPVNFNLVGYFRYLYSGDPMAPAPIAELVEFSTQTPLGPLTIMNVMTPNGPADAGVLVAAPNTVFPTAGFRPFEGAGVQIPAGVLSPPLVGLQLQIRVTFPDGSALFSRDLIAITP